MAFSASASNVFGARTPSYYQSLSSFAPELLKHVLLANGELSAPFVCSFESVGFFADVSGFTKATESLSNALGDLGTEILANKINAYLPHIAKKIVGSGGDVVKFAGDAILCIWPPPPDCILNEHEEQYKRIEAKRRKYADLTDKQKLLLQSKNEHRIQALEAQFEEIKNKYLQQKFENEKKQKEHAKKNVHAAIQCAIEIQQNYGRMDLSGYNDTSKMAQTRKSGYFSRKSKKIDERNQKIEFRVKLGIGIGKIQLLIVGGLIGRCEYLICGDGLIQAFDCENDCDPDEERMVVVSDKVRQIEGISDNFEIRKCEASSNYEVLGANKKTRKRIERRQYGHLVPNTSNNLASLLVNYVPAAVKPHLDMPQQIWTGELREVTILFISLPWNARSFAKFTHKILAELQHIIYTLQDVIYKYQGSLNKFLIDDKGSTVMAVFGLPPVAHTNDPVRAVLAALELAEKIGTPQKPAAIGISCGTVFVGIIGSKGSRREYGILGDKVNLSARLMGLSKKNHKKFGEIVCDTAICERCKLEPRISWNDLGRTHVKGKAEAVRIWQPSQTDIPVTAHKLARALYLETSDKKCLSMLEGEIERFMKSNHAEHGNDESTRDGRVVLVQGSIGIGKSSILGQVQVRNNAQVWFLWGKANEFHECYPIDYIVWKQILLGYTSRYSLITSKNRWLFQQYVKVRRPDLERWLFLLGELIELGNYKLLEDEFLSVAVSARNKQLYASAPANQIRKHRHDIVFCLLEWTARVKPIAIIIDELQFLTGADWQITRRLCFLVHRKLLKNVMVFVASTPIDNVMYRPLFKPQKLIDDFVAMRDTYSHLVCGPLPWGLNKTKFYIAQKLDIGDCSPRVVETIHSQCGGRPGFTHHFIEHLCHPPHAGKYIRIISRKLANGVGSPKTPNGHSSASLNSQNSGDADVPRNDKYCCFDEEIDSRFKIGLDVSFPTPPYVMQITLSHMDKLSAEQLFVLKVAAVICKSKGNNSVRFEEHMIRGCHPLAETGMNAMHRLRATLDSLCKMQFIYKCSSGTGAGSSKRPSASQSRVSDTRLFDDDIGVEMDGQAHQHKQQPSYMDFDRDPSTIPMENHSANDDHKGHGHGDGDEFMDETLFDGITDPMPSTKALLQEPSKSIPYKKGRMYKRGTSFINMTEVQRIFVFKHATLYWVKDENEDYPRSRIKFDRSLKNLKIEDKRTVSIKTPRKEYILRCSKKQEMEAWVKLFKDSIRAHLLNEAWAQRLGDAEKQQKMYKPQLQLNGNGSNVSNGDFGVVSLPSLSEMAAQISAGASAATPASSGSPHLKSEPYRPSVVDVDYHQSRSHTTSPQHKAAVVAVPTIASVKEEADDEKGDLTQFDDYRPSAKSPTQSKKVGFNEQANTHHSGDIEFDDEEDIDADPEEDALEDDDDDNAVPPEDVLNELRQQLSSGHFDIEAATKEPKPVIPDFDAQISPHLRQHRTDDDVFDVIGVNSDDSDYVFSYGFLRDILYEGMLHSQRKQLHANALKYIAKFLASHYDDKLALMHTRHIECQQKYSDMLQGNNPQLNGMLAAKKRASRLGGLGGFLG